MNIVSYSNLTHEFCGNPVLEFQTVMSEENISALTQIVIQESLSQLRREGFEELTQPFVGLGFSGWNKVNILDWPFDECQKLKNLFLDGFEIYLEEFRNQYRKSRPNFVTCWPNVIKAYDGKVRSHIHHANPFNVTGVYYLAGEFQKDIVKTLFFPETRGRTLEKIYTPILGSMIIFPANLAHLVLPYPSEVLRISLSFDIFFEKKPNVPYSVLKP